MSAVTWLATSMLWAQVARITGPAADVCMDGVRDAKADSGWYTYQAVRALIFRDEEGSLLFINLDTRAWRHRPCLRL
jgi:hypothetical protein